ncbi:7TM diverse intracellular signaling domain-containing protein [Oligoflexus tunisiensis]|uniref:7TM diverse intracellular signaling domain-containing protein n=1 Tax=Oligoflexus tunisiensis TaxID=708132 RepID=UPI000B20FDC0|nr:7TM diverse intracellular signaling domain-containing protein [Oligoflexus tunisiensis]
MLGLGIKTHLRAYAAKSWLLFVLCCGINQTALAQLQSTDLADLKDDELVELKGPWDFFPSVWLDPGDERAAPATLPAGQSWTFGAAETQFRSGEGFATYRLSLVHLQPRMEGYSLALRSAGTALKIMIYPRNKPHKMRFATAGRLGRNAEEEIPQLRLVSLRFFPEEDETEWVVLAQVSNFHYARGGLWTVPFISAGESANLLMETDRELLLLCLGMIAVIGIYNVVLFIRRPADKPTLMLALFCVLVCLRSMASDDLISWYIPTLDTRIFEFKYLVEYATIILAPWTGNSFLHMTFLSSSSQRFYRFTSFLSLVALVAIVALDTYYRSLILNPIQVVTLVHVIFGLSVVVRAVLHRRQEAVLAALGAFALTVCVVHDSLISYNIFSQPYLMAVGMSVFIFMQGQVVAQRFAKAFRVAEHLSQKLKDEVERQTLELRSIMENIPQGVFIMLDDQTIQGNYSRELEQLLHETDLTGRAALPILFKDSQLTKEDRSITDTVLLNAFHEPTFVWDLNAPLLPHEFVRQDAEGQPQIIAIEWHPIVNRRDVVDRVLVTVRNVTEIRNLQASQRKDQQAFALLLEIVQVAPGRFRDFIQQSHMILHQAQEEIRADVTNFAVVQRKVLMWLHTWKGVARSLRFKTMASHIHDVEQTLGSLKNADGANMQKEIEGLQEKLRDYEQVGKERLGRMDEHAVGAAATAEARQLVQAWYRYHHETGERHRQVMEHAVEAFVRTVPDITTGQLLQSLQGEVNTLAQELDKPQPRIESLGALDHPLPDSIYKSLSYALQHLIRNSMDHGLEVADERQSKGKDPRGRITISFSVHQGTLIMDYRDDGRGLDLTSVLQKAQEMGLAAPAAVLKPHETAALIFAPGFSTKESVNMISGRGVGMDAVRLLVEECGGTVALVLKDETALQQPFHLRATWAVETLMDQVA